MNGIASELLPSAVASKSIGNAGASLLGQFRVGCQSIGCARPSKKTAKDREASFVPSTPAAYRQVKMQAQLLNER